MNRETFFQMGINPAAPKAGFNMTAFALRMTASHNAVSKKHGEITRRMWQVLWPDLPADKVPIDHVTNGIHVPTWTEPKMMLLFNKYLGPDWVRVMKESIKSNGQIFSARRMVKEYVQKFYATALKIVDVK